MKGRNSSLSFRREVREIRKFSCHSSGMKISLTNCPTTRSSLCSSSPTSSSSIRFWTWSLPRRSINKWSQEILYRFRKINAYRLIFAAVSSKQATKAEIRANNTNTRYPPMLDRLFTVFTRKWSWDMQMQVRRSCFRPCTQRRRAALKPSVFDHISADGRWERIKKNALSNENALL